MQIHENISLKQYNTFGINVQAKQFAAFSSTDELDELIEYFTNHDSRFPVRDSRPTPPANSRLPIHDSRLLVLGGGSNILFTKDFDGVVLKNELKGIELIKEDDHYYYIKAGAGENWHGLVMYCIEKGYAGLENLSLIPGCAGASPMQNIGAYGVEIKDVFESLEAYHIQEKKIVQFSVNDCAFGYRESVFKGKYKGQFVIVSVTYRLRKQPVYNTSYGAIEQELEKMGVQQLSIQAVSQAVINIRRSKLPDPAEIGNAGSFFKNPQIPIHKYNELRRIYTNIPGYPVNDTEIKVAAGWLIEQCGWKGYRYGDTGVHAKQALVLVNYGNAKGEDIYALSGRVIESVQAKFGIALEREVNIV